MAEDRKKGLIIVHTGPGKGKTTAALGLAFRAVGSGRLFIAEPPGACLGEHREAARRPKVARSFPVAGATGRGADGVDG